MFSFQHLHTEHKAYKKTRKVWPIQREINKSTEIVPEKDLMADLLDKDFKTTVLKTLKKLKEATVKVKKMMSEQHGNTKRET